MITICNRESKVAEEPFPFFYSVEKSSPVSTFSRWIFVKHFLLTRGVQRGKRRFPVRLPAVFKRSFLDINTVCEALFKELSTFSTDF